ncbi:MAG: 2,3-diphosphoglycerate-dependent phosphoglycerate mutase [Bacteroidales bacterium]|jgi:2,3-bisphosphoglycerate-dependent phosphoglycerate mutase|nr:2,3-diphosphoglycerate-dependent phosphoglycerate mutase [Bacteroidales bacterium]
MKKLILVRHGQSEWNKWNLFTGWTDVDLTSKGLSEAFDAGLRLKNEGYKPQICFTSYLKRAVKTLNQILDAMNMDYLPVEKSWRLNEKHYGVLQAKNKKEMVEKFGIEKVQQWRRGYNCPPPELEGKSAEEQLKDPRYAELLPEENPLTEGLKDCIDRLMPFYYEHILKAFDKYDEVLVVAHGNSLRGIVKTLKNITDEEISGLNLPTAIPYIFELDNGLKLQRDFFLAEASELAKLQQEVANQSK